MSIVIAIAAAIFAPAPEAEERVALYFQTEPGAPLQSRTLGLADGRWRLGWSCKPKKKGARVISVASLGDRVGVLWSVGEQRRYAEVNASDGRSLGRDRAVSQVIEAILVAGGRPMALDTGGEPHAIGVRRRKATLSSAHTQVHGEQTSAVSTQDGRYVLAAYSEAARGSSYSYLDSYSVGRVMRKTMETILSSPAVVDLAISSTVAAVGRQWGDVEFYRIGPNGLTLLDKILVQPPVGALCPLRKDVGFYGLTPKGIVVLQPEGKRWSQRPVLALDVGYQMDPWFVETPDCLGLIAGKTIYRMRRGKSGSLKLLGRSNLPPGWVR